MVEETEDVVEARKKKLEEEQKELDKKQLKEAGKEQPQSMLDKAHEENDRMERLLKKKEELLDREEAMRVRDTLGGESEAGAAPVGPKEETPGEYAKKVMEGEPHA